MVWLLEKMGKSIAVSCFEARQGPMNDSSPFVNVFVMLIQVRNQQKHL